MSAARLLDELLSGFAPQDPVACSCPTPANPANPANHGHRRGVPPDSVPCERSRISAKTDPVEALPAADSQRFAAVRSEQNGLASEETRALSQASQDSHGLAKPTDDGAGLAAVAWTDADIAQFLNRRARLLRWRWPEPEAERLAERLTLRDREADTRVSCIECGHYRPGRCGNHRRADLASAEVGHDLAVLLQQCPGFRT